MVAALLTIDINGNQLKSPAKGDLLNQLWCVHKMECYKAVKKVLWINTY